MQQNSCCSAQWGPSTENDSMRAEIKKCFGDRHRAQALFICVVLMKIRKLDQIYICTFNSLLKSEAV